MSIFSTPTVYNSVMPLNIRFLLLFFYPYWRAQMSAPPSPPSPSYITDLGVTPARKWRHKYGPRLPLLWRYWVCMIGNSHYFLGFHLLNYVDAIKNYMTSLSLRLYLNCACLIQIFHGVCANSAIWKSKVPYKTARSR